MIRFLKAWKRGDRYTARLILQEAWWWPRRNAMVSHMARPWDAWNTERVIFALHREENTPL